MRLLAVALLASLFSAPLPAQGDALPDPPRPVLPADADTNDARFYMLHARAAKSADDRYAAYLWAHRLKPARVDFLDGMASALLSKRSILWRLRYLLGDPSTREEALGRQIDSLRRRMDLRDPFHILPPARGTCTGMGQPPSRGRLALTDKQQAEWYVGRGYGSLREGCYYRVLEELAEGVRRDSMLEPHLHIRALALYKLQRQEEATADMQRAIGGLRRLQAESIEQSFFTTAMFEYVSGMMAMSIGDAITARRAFERALVEDLSMHMAHVRLGELAMRRGDLPSALESYSLASQIRPDDALALADYGQALARAERLEEARAAYEQAIGHAPYYADLRFTLAELLERIGDAPAALAAYREYIARAPRADALQLEFASGRIATLEAAPPAPDPR